MLAIVLLYALLGLSFTVSKGVLTYAYPTYFTALRMGVAGLFLLGIHVFVNKGSLRFNKQHLSQLLQLGFFHGFAAYVFEFWALEHVSAAKDALFFNLTPFMSALLAMPLRKEYLTAKQWVGLVIGFVGFFPILMAQTPLEELLGGSFLSMAEVQLLIAVASGAYGWFLLQNLVKDNNYSPMFANGFGMVLGSFICLVVAWFTEPAFVKAVVPGQFWSHDVPMMLWYLSMLVILTNVIFNNLYAYLLRSYSATFLALVGSTTPIFTAIFDWLIYGELITWHFVATVVIIFVGLYVFYSDEIKTLSA